ncbi:putative type II secretion system protein [Campylobacter ureolyticus RIGS 9880]|uniref:Type II secretion system protein n=1 Tax=Campylobacter ureolyticus RIGS 9880 TaxID=1032069 RepID=A0AAU8TXT4_9BACT|nr:type II secretion system protein [Campylobacter ureolyticus]AKT90065.1 putative type II secretion system protein [Campylobacter ureolyticus RIGS 9880]
MKKGFTMIELIFVIVILGILAAVAIPRLAATRDDAEVSKAATNIQTAISDISAYYTSQGAFGTIAQMTNVPSPIKVKKQACLTWGNTDNDKGEITVTVVKGTGLCKQVWAMPGLTQVATYIASTDGGKTENTIKVGGMGVNFEGADTTTNSNSNSGSSSNN